MSLSSEIERECLKPHTLSAYCTRKTAESSLIAALRRCTLPNQTTRSRFSGQCVLGMWLREFDFAPDPRKQGQASAVSVLVVPGMRQLVFGFAVQHARDMK